MLLDELDPDVVRWGLQDLQVCCHTDAGSSNVITEYKVDSCTVGCVREEYHEPVTSSMENDLIIAQTYQEELSRVAEAEASGFNNSSQSSVVEQKWCHTSPKTNCPEAADVTQSGESRQNEAGVPAKEEEEPDSLLMNVDNSSLVVQRQDDEGFEIRKKRLGDDSWRTLELCKESSELGCEVGKRLNQMVPVPHVPKINGELPSMDEEVSDHQLLLYRLQLYGLVENKVQGDGNCQFRSLADQLYRSGDHHGFVRKQVVQQLKLHPEMYGGYVPMSYQNYLKKMSTSGEWGDHVTLQAAADWFGIRIFMLTSFKDTCYIEILPRVQKSNRVLCLSFWAEVHYNSIYPEGELPIQESRKKKKWWLLGNL